MKKSYIESYNIYTYISFPIVPNTKYTVKEEFSPSEKHSRLNEITKSSQSRYTGRSRRISESVFKIRSSLRRFNPVRRYCNRFKLL